MTNSPTVKALVSTVLTFAVIIAAGTFTKAIGQQTGTPSAVPATTPYEPVDPDPIVARHNHPDRQAPITKASHNLP